MTTRSRSRLFLSLAALFLIASPVIIFWSQGYRFDLKTRSFVQVGGLYFKVIPQDAQLTVEGIGSRRLCPSMLSEGTLLHNLIPDTYEISVNREGYFPWSKSLKVNPLQVTKATAIILFPAVPPIEQLGAFAVADFWPAGEGNGAFYFTDTSGRRLFFVKNPRQEAEPQPILGTAPEAPLRDRIADLLPSPDGAMLLVKLAGGDAVLADTSRTRVRFLSRYAAQLGMPVTRFEKLFWHPAAERKLIGVTSQNRIYEIDLEASAYRRLLVRESIIGLNQTGTIIADSSGNLYRLSNRQEGAEKFDQISLPRGISRARIFALPQRQYLLLDDAHANLWHIERGGEPRLIAEGVIGAWPHPHSLRVALITKNQVLSVYFLEETAGDVRYEKGELLQLGLVEQNPNDVFWLKDGWHVLVVEPKQIAVLEVDSRYPINRVSYPIAASRAFWTHDENRLVYASQNSLWSWRLVD